MASKPNDLTWKNTVLDELVCCHIYSGEHEDNPRKALQDVISWNVQIALDPQVSEDAQALIDRGQGDIRKIFLMGFVMGMPFGTLLIAAGNALKAAGY